MLELLRVKKCEHDFTELKNFRYKFTLKLSTKSLQQLLNRVEFVYSITP